MTEGKEQRQLDQVQRGLAAQRLIDDEIVMAWFAAKHTELVEKMLSAKLSDDETRREAAGELSMLRELKRMIEAEAGAGRRTQDTIEKRKTSK